MDHKKKAAIKRRRATPEQKGFSPRSVLRSAFLASLIGLTVGLLLLLLLARVFLVTKDPLRVTVPAGVVALYLSAALSGALAVRLCHRTSAPLSGGAVGIFYLVLLLPLGLILKGGTMSSGIRLLLALPVAISAMLGAKWARRSKKRRHHRY